MSSRAFSPKSRVVALLFCLFLGVWGIHRLYLGRFWSGAVQFLTLGGCGIWWLIDLYRCVLGQMRDGEGREVL